MGAIKKILLKICPEIKENEEKSQKQIEQIRAEFEKKNKQNDKKLKKQNDKIDRILNNTVRIREELHNTCMDVKKVRIELHDTHLKTNEIYDYQYDFQCNLMQKLNYTERKCSETLWAEIFNNTIASSEWLVNRSFSLGRWAIGYPCAYVLYRVIDELHPNKILELGLGQSTKIISQYTRYYNPDKHIVIEHDPEWISFFSKNYSLPDETEIIQCPLMNDSYKEQNGIRQFQNFSQAVGSEKYDLIMIDAPFGGDMKEYARVDVLKKMPQCLEESFVIIFDDCNREGEQNTFYEMVKVLEDANIDYKVGTYSGDKIIKVICSVDNSFVTSM